MKENNSIAKAIKEPGFELIVDMADLTLGEIAEKLISDESLISETPIIRYGVLVGKIGTKISALSFIRKYACFIGPIQKNARQYSKIRQRLEELEKDSKKLDKLLEMTIIAIDSYKEKELAKYLGELFVKTFRDEVFTIEEYNTIMFSLDIMHPYIGVERLKEFYKLRKDMEIASTQEQMEALNIKQCNMDYSPLATTCLINLPQGGSYLGVVGGATINELGIRFVENILNHEES